MTAARFKRDSFRNTGSAIQEHRQRDGHAALDGTKRSQGRWFPIPRRLDQLIEENR
jgi:hypothetical protein